MSSGKTVPEAPAPLAEASSVTKEIPDSGPPSSPPLKATASAVPGDKDEGTHFTTGRLVWNDDDDEDQPLPLKLLRCRLPQALGRNVSVSFVIRRRRFVDDEGPRDPSLAKRPSLPASPSSTPMESTITAGILERTLEVILAEMSPRLTSLLVILKTVPPQPRVQFSWWCWRRSSPARLMFLVAKVPQRYWPSRCRRRDIPVLVLLHLSEEHHRRNFSSTSIAASRVSSPAQPLPMSHQVVQGPRRQSYLRELSTVGPTILGHAIHCSWSQELLRACLEEGFTGPDAGDVVIHVTSRAESVLRLRGSQSSVADHASLLREEPCLFDIAGFDPSSRSKRAPYDTRIKVLWANFAATVPSQISGSRSGSDTTGYSLVPSRRVLRGKQVIPPRPSSLEEPVHEVVSGVGHRASLFVHSPELIVEPSVPSYPVEPLPFVPKNTDWLAEAAVLGAPSTMACGMGVCAIRPPVQHHVRSLPPDAPIFCSRTADPIAIGRAIMADPSLTPAQLAPDWQRRFFSARGFSSSIICCCVCWWW
ncbi:hypothetical protein GQ600_11390 [Phytophthora cactorum]|nr:hypothetical protein GQ600_11390 [Phytophthora cactorum]